MNKTRIHRHKDVKQNLTSHDNNHEKIMYINQVEYK